MSRLQTLLTALVLVLVIVIFWFLVYSPKQDELAEIEAQIELEETQQMQLQAELDSLRAVRAQAPAAEAALAASRALVPSDPALPALLRQMQLAADEAGITLTSVTASRPTILDAELGLAEVNVTVQTSGTYFQEVDFLRRLEDPSITPRGILWQSLSVAPSDYPELAMTVGGSIFTLVSDGDVVAEEDEIVEDEDAALDPDDEPLDPEPGTEEQVG